MSQEGENLVFSFRQSTHADTGLFSRNTAAVQHVVHEGVVAGTRRGFPIYVARLRSLPPVGDMCIGVSRAELDGKRVREGLAVFINDLPREVVAKDVPRPTLEHTRFVSRPKWTVGIGETSPTRPGSEPV